MEFILAVLCALSSCASSFMVLIFITDMSDIAVNKHFANIKKNNEFLQSENAFLIEKIKKLIKNEEMQTNKIGELSMRIEELTMNLTAQELVDENNKLVSLYSKLHSNYDALKEEVIRLQNSQYENNRNNQIHCHMHPYVQENGKLLY